MAASSSRPSLLLHCCCAPCACYVLEYLCPHFDVTAFFYNPNIQPKEEFEKRLFWLRRLLEKLPFEVKLIEAPYMGEDFSQAVRGLEGEPEGGRRCEACISMRLRETAKAAQERGFDYFCTTLSVSPHKDAKLINTLGEGLSDGRGALWLPSDFKKRGGYERSVRLSKELGLYRQDYCGCIFGKNIV